MSKKLLVLTTVLGVLLLNSVQESLAQNKINVPAIRFEQNADSSLVPFRRTLAIPEILEIELDVSSFKKTGKRELGPHGVEKYWYGKNSEINLPFQGTPTRIIISDTTKTEKGACFNIDPFSSWGLYDQTLVIYDDDGDPVLIDNLLPKSLSGDSAYTQAWYDFHYDHRYKWYSYNDNHLGGLYTLDTNFSPLDTFYASHDGHATSIAYVPAINRHIFMFVQALWDTLPNGIEVVHGARFVFVDADTKEEFFSFRSDDLLDNGELVFPYELSYVDSYHNSQMSWIGLDYIHVNFWKIEATPEGGAELSISGLHPYEDLEMGLEVDSINRSFTDNLHLIERIRPWWDQYNKIAWSSSTSHSSTHQYGRKVREILPNGDTMIYAMGTNNNWASNDRPDLDIEASLIFCAVNVTKDTGVMKAIFVEDLCTFGWGGTTSDLDFRVDNPTFVQLVESVLCFSPGAPSGIGTSPMGIPWGNPQLVFIGPNWNDGMIDTLIMVDFVSEEDTNYWLQGVQYNSYYMVDMDHLLRQQPQVIVEQDPNDTMQWILTAVGVRPSDYVIWTDSVNTVGYSLTVRDTGDYFACIHYVGSRDSALIASKRVTIPPKPRQNDTTSVQVINIPKEKDIVVYPNPTNGDLMYVRTDYEFVQYQISNLLGQTTVENSITTSREVQITISDLPAGTYFLTLFDEEGRRVTKQFARH